MSKDLSDGKERMQNSSFPTLWKLCSFYQHSNNHLFYHKEQKDQQDETFHFQENRPSADLGSYPQRTSILKWHSLGQYHIRDIMVSKNILFKRRGKQGTSPQMWGALCLSLMPLQLPVIELYKEKYAKITQKLGD